MNKKTIIGVLVLSLLLFASAIAMAVAEQHQADAIRRQNELLEYEIGLLKEHSLCETAEVNGGE